MTETKTPAWVKTVTSECASDSAVQKLIVADGVCGDGDASLRVLCDRARLWLRICNHIAECKTVSEESWWASMKFVYAAPGSKQGQEYSSPLLKAMIHCCQFAITVLKSNGVELAWLRRACVICNELLHTHTQVCKTWTEHGKVKFDKGVPVFWHLEYATMLSHLARARTQTALFLNAETADAEVAVGAVIHYSHYNRCRKSVRDELAAGPLTSDKAYETQFKALSDGHLFLMYTSMARRLALDHKITQSDYCFRAAADGAATAASERKFWGVSDPITTKDLHAEHRALLRDNDAVYHAPVGQDLDLCDLPHRDVVKGLSIKQA